MGQLAQQSRQIMPIPQGGGGMSEQMRWATQASGAGILPQAYRGKPADVLVAIGLGQSMGLSPAESLYRINVINGKPTMSAELVAAQVRKAGHRLRIRKDAANLSVTVQIVRADDPDYPFTVTRDREWAERMGLAGKDNYRRQPLTMLMWRAITACAREACPEALYGVAYTADEMHDMDAAPSQPDPAPSQETLQSDRLALKRADVAARFKRMNADWTVAKPVIERLIGRQVNGLNDMSEAELDKVLADLKAGTKENQKETETKEETE